MESSWNMTEYLFSRVENWDKPAYLFHDECISYRDVKDKTNRLTSFLKSNGVKPSSRVLLFMNDTPMFIASFLSVIQQGAIPIPLNPRSKSEMIKHYLKDSDACLVIAEKETVTQISSIDNFELDGINVLLQDVYSDDNQLSNDIGMSFSSLSQSVDSDICKEYFQFKKEDTVFVQYTSGTTGLPKAVMHNGQGMIKQTAVYTHEILKLNNDDVLYSTAKLFFGYGLGNSLFFPFFNHASCVLDDRWPTPQVVYENLVRFKPSVVFSVPTIFGALLEEGENIARILGSDIRFVSAGSPLPTVIFNAWKCRHEIIILDGIGATEMGHIFLTNTIDNAKGSSLGKVVPGYEVKLVDEKGSADGDERGVLYVKGFSVSKGYMNLPDKNAERFSEGWFRTGDVFTKDESGRYFYEGREDDLFKIKGRWVSPLDIENFVMSNFKKVKEAALVCGADNDGLPKSYMFLSVDDSVRSLDKLKNDIFELISEGFEAHCVPNEYRTIEKMPRNDNGKLLRHQLLGSISQDLESEFIN